MMEYVSTRNKNIRVTASQAIAAGLAPDGGLFTPAEIPAINEHDIRSLCALPYAERAAVVLGLYLTDFTKEELLSYTKQAYEINFPKNKAAPIIRVGEGRYLLELWHGPTCAFKDMALQLLPHLLTASLAKNGEKRTVCILVATSGDTGKAALEGFADVPGTKILVFYPKDGVSEVQRLQMVTQSGGNVGVCGIAGNFDDAQAAVKRIFNDADLARLADENGMFFSSANSINWGRLAPQIVYYISAYCDLLNQNEIAYGEPVNVVVPTGNFGNILAAYFAKRMGLPIDRLICASNKNDVLTEFFACRGRYDANRSFFNTISPSMDILVSSNLERFLYYATDGDDRQVAYWMESLRENGGYEASSRLNTGEFDAFYGGSLTDRQTKETIAKLWNEQHYLVDPHTAVACGVHERYVSETGDGKKAIIASTANPYKFCDSVLSALENKTVTGGTALISELFQKTGVIPPPSLPALALKPERFKDSCEKDEILSVVRAMLGIRSEK